MNSIKLLLLLSACLLVGCSQSKQVPSNVEDWVVHKDQNHQVKLPFEPQPFTQSANNPLVGNLQVKMFVCEISRDQAILVSRMKLPVPPQQYSVEGGLMGAVQGLRGETKGSIQSEKNIKQGSIRGKEVVVSTPDKFMIRARLFIDGRGPVLYQYQLIGDKKFINSQVASNFLDSIQITPLAGPDKSGRKNQKRF